MSMAEQTADGQPAASTAAWRAILAPYAASRLAILLVGVLALTFGDLRQRPWQVSSSPWLDLWARWDSGYYLDIASNGYSYIPGEASNVAFFPLYPLLLRLFTLNGESWLALTIAGALLSHTFTFLAFLFLYRLVCLDEKQVVARRTVWLVAFFPASLFYSAVYSEALFAALTIAAFYWARRKRWLAAAVAGSFSGLARSIGFLLLLPLLIQWLQQRPRRWRQVWLLALVPAGLLLFIIFLQIEFGNPLLFVEAHRDWGRDVAASGLRERLQYLIFQADLWQRLADNLADILFAATGLGLLFISLRRLRPSYVVYTAYVLGIPLATLQVYSTPRFLLVAFPLFILAARYLENRRLFLAILTLSALLLAYFVVRWSLWLWVA